MMQFELFEGKDNFPTIVKYVGRGGSDYATELVAFQQVAPSNTVETLDSLVLSKKSWRLFSEDIKIDYKPVPKIKEPGGSCY